MKKMMIILAAVMLAGCGKVDDFSHKEGVEHKTETTPAFTFAPAEDRPFGFRGEVEKLKMIFDPAKVKRVKAAEEPRARTSMIPAKASAAPKRE